jgi:hypothetical protein
MFEANEAWDDSEGGIRKLCNETMLIDTLTVFTGQECEIATYSRGRKRINHILTSQNLLPHLVHVGYLPFFKANNGNHRGLFIDINNDLLDTKIKLQRPKKRMVGISSKPLEIYNFKKELDKQCTLHNLYNKAEEAFGSTFLPKLPKDRAKTLHIIDSQITNFTLRAERICCPKPHDTNWSVAVHNKSVECRYWILRQRGVKLEINNQVQRERI